jgi:hypothetical protein
MMSVCLNHGINIAGVHHGSRDKDIAVVGRVPEERDGRWCLLAEINRGLEGGCEDGGPKMKGGFNLVAAVRSSARSKMPGGLPENSQPKVKYAKHAVCVCACDKGWKMKYSLENLTRNRWVDCSGKNKSDETLKENALHVQQRWNETAT